MNEDRNIDIVAVVVVFLTVVGLLVIVLGKGEQEYASIDVRLEGLNYCVACTLHKAGANSSCGVDGHRHAFKVTIAYNSDGRKLPQLEGDTVHYIYNTKGKEYADGHHGEALNILGKLFANQHVIDITEVESTK